MIEPASSTPSPVTSTRPLDGLGTALFVHTVHLPKKGQPRAGVEAIRELLDRDGIGVVYTVPRNKGRLGMWTRPGGGPQVRRSSSTRTCTADLNDARMPPTGSISAG